MGHQPLATRSAHYSSPLKCLMRQHIRAITESLVHLGRHFLTSVATVALLSILLTLPMIFYLLFSQPGGGLQQYVQTSPSISVYLNPEIQNDQRDQIQSTILAMKDVHQVQMITPAQGMGMVSHAMGMKRLNEWVSEKLLPTVLIIKPNKNIKSPEAFQALSSDIEKIDGTSTIQMDWKWVVRLYNLLTLSQRLSLFILIVFIFSSLFIIANMIRLSLVKEMPRMKVLALLGAPSAFIRRSFLYRGVSYGALAGMLSCFVVNMMANALDGPLQKLLESYDQTFSLSLQLSPSAAFMLIAIAIMTTYVGAWLAVLMAKQLT